MAIGDNKGGGADSGKGMEEVGRTESSPWAPVQGDLKYIADQFKGAFGDGLGFTPSGASLDALSQIRNIAGAGNPLVGQGSEFLSGIIGGNGLPPGLMDALQPAQDLAGGNGLSSGIDAALNPARAIAGGDGGITTGGQYSTLFNQAGRNTASDSIAGAYAKNGVPLANGVAGSLASGATGLTTEGDFRGLLSEAGGPGAAEQYLTATARGDYLKDGSNPFLEEAIQPQLDKTANTVRDYLGGMGRLGNNGTTVKNLTESLGGIRAGAAAQNWENERDRQIGAAGTIEGAQQGRLGLSRGILGDITGVEGANIDYRMAGENQVNANRVANANIRMGAAGQVDQARQGARGQQLSALAGRTGVDQANVANKLAASGFVADTLGSGLDRKLAASGYVADALGQGLDRQFGAVDRIAALNDARYGDAERLWEAGQAEEGYDARKLAMLGDWGGFLGSLGGTTVASEPRRPFQKFLGTLGTIAGGIGAMRG